MPPTHRILLKYNDDKEVEPSPNKMTFFEELYIEAETENISNGQRLKVQIHPKQDVHVNELTIELPYAYQATDAIFCNGFQTQTESLVYSPNDSISKLGALASSHWHQLGNYHHPHLKDLSANLHSWTYTNVQRADGSYLLIGSLSENTGFTILKHCCNLNVIKITWEASDFQLSHSFPVMDIVILEGNEKTIFDQYAQLMNTGLKEFPPPLRSCQCISTTTGVNKLQKTIHDFSEQGVPIDLVLLNEGFPLAMGDWLTGADQVPKGIPDAAKMIRQTGTKSGIKVAPFLCSAASDFFINKKECLLKGQNGTLISIKNKHAKEGRYYILDFYNKTVTDFLTSVFTTLTQRWSYDLIALDWMYVLCLSPPANKTMGQTICESLDFIRKQCDGTLIMADRIPLGAAFGRVDYGALASYPLSAWKSSWLRWNHVRERETALSTIPTHMNRRFLANRFFKQAPSLLIRSDQLFQYSLYQQQTLLLINSLCGAGFMLPDKGLTDQVEEQISEFIQAVKDQQSHITRVSLQSIGMYEIHFTLDAIHWVAYINLKRNKNYFFHNGQRIALESCESMVLTQHLQNVPKS